MSRGSGLLVLALLFAAVAYLIPHPAGVTPAAWRQAAIFLCVIVGMILQPLPASALVLLGLIAMVANGSALRDVLGGYAEPSVWLVVAALLIARSLLSSGLARRIALFFLRAFGRSSLGISYALVLTDVSLAAGVPSITARSAGMVLPVPVSIAELMDSRPGPSAGRLGTFLIAATYQASAVACAMFLTGQASNILGANLAQKLVGVNVTWSSWFIAAIVPGLVSCAIVPWVVYRALTPSITRTPEAAAFAARELTVMGRPSRDQWITLAVFLGIGLLWMSSSWHKVDVTFIALCGVAMLLITGTVDWSNCVADKSVWDMFVWYGGLLKMGELLNTTGVTKVFADNVGGVFGDTHWLIVLVGILIVYFYTHYLFASITAHVLAMFPPFVVLLTTLGTPPELAVFSLLCLANLPAGLTHYGTTTGPIFFGLGYVSLRDWWRVGFLVSLANLAIWLTVGFAWWKVLGFW